MKIKLIYGGAWESETRYGRIVFCRSVIGKLFPKIKGQKEATLFISSSSKEGFVPVALNRRGYSDNTTFSIWRWEIPKFKFDSDSLDCFAHREGTTTSILKSVKHCSEEKLPKLVKIWINVE